MFKPNGIWICALAIVTGCSTGPRPIQKPVAAQEKPASATAWSPRDSERVPEAPRLAPPPLSSPETSRPRANSYAETWISLMRWARENDCGYLQQVSAEPQPTFSLTAPRGVLRLSAKSQSATWNGLELRLGFEPQLINDRLFVHALDLKKNIEPLLRDFEPATRTNRVIVIDPGHGGQNTGTVSVEDGLPEKEFTLDWANRLAAVLATNGWHAILTRTNDLDVSLSNRVALAEENKADLFVSLHFNSAAPSQEQAGLETYCLTPAGMPSTLTRGYEDDVSLVFANNAYDAPNLQYAVQLHRALLAVVGVDRAVRHARFLGVLRGQRRPAVLIEGGYLSNPAEARRIADPEYRQQLAEALAEALTGRNLRLDRAPDDGSTVSSPQPPPAALPTPAADPGTSNLSANLPLLP